MIVLSASRLLDSRLKKEELETLLEKTKGTLFFLVPSESDHWDALQLKYGKSLWSEIAGRFVTGHLGVIRTAELAVFLLDRATLEKSRLTEHQLLSVTQWNPAERAFIVPLMAPKDVVKEIHLGFSLLEQSSVLNDLTRLDLETQILLAEVAKGVTRAERLITTSVIRQELEQAERAVVTILKGL